MGIDRAPVALFGVIGPSFTSQERAPRVEVDVLPTQRHQLAAAQSGVERGRPHSSVVEWERLDQPSRLLRLRDSIAPPTYRGQLQSACRVHDDIAARDRTPEDRPQRHEGVPDGRGVQTFGEQPIGEVLEVEAAYLAELHGTELG
jgi:hypothetical protein